MLEKLCFKEDFDAVFNGKFSISAFLFSPGKQFGHFGKPAHGYFYHLVGSARFFMKKASKYVIMVPSNIKTEKR